MFDICFLLRRTHSAAPKRRSTKWGPAVLAPLGAFGSAGTVVQKACRTRIRILTQTSADSKSLLRTPPCPPTRPGGSPFSDPRSIFSIFLVAFCRSKIHRKTDPSNSTPKSRKCNPERPKVDFEVVFAPPFGLHFVIIFHTFCRSLKSRKHYKNNGF